MEKNLSVSVLTQLLRYLESIGIDTKSLLRKVGFDSALAEAPDGRIPVEMYVALENEAQKITRDPCLGLYVGQFHVPGSWGIVDYIMMNCPTLGEAMQQSRRYAKIVSYLIKAKPVIKPGRIEIILYTPGTDMELSPHCYLTVQTSTVQMFRTLTGQQISPLGISTMLPDPGAEGVGEYSTFFRCPVTFSAKRYSITVPMSMFALPVVQPNSALADHFIHLADQMLEDMEDPGTVTSRVTNLIITNLEEKDLKIRSIAREMAMSVRTLQNKLEQEGAVYSELVEEVRSRLACTYLRENRTVEDTSFLLGFSDTSAFYKAFRRWKNMTPRQYRTAAVD